ncbi:MAG TPA: hypothetical protein VJN21_15265 [Candidatus Acidoferrales bacterium]|nr:hypothetical protein [Candidatus Acidoferrales bacterium]
MGAFYLLACILSVALLSIPASASGQKSKETENKVKYRTLRWDPPDVDKLVEPLAGAPACVLSDVLQHAASRAKQMEDNLASFTADETIQYESIIQNWFPPQYGFGKFKYAVDVATGPSGASIEETRMPMKGTQSYPASDQDRGLPELALIFLPKFQSDYDMECDGETKRNYEAAWVIHFRQRSDVPAHAFSYVDGHGGSYAAKLKGRAWISADFGEVVHLETALMEGIPDMRVQDSWFSIDYGPVQFQSKNVRLWLPHTVSAYVQFDDRRTILYHTFSNFVLVWTQTKQEIKKPSKPQ